MKVQVVESYSPSTHLRIPVEQLVEIQGEFLSGGVVPYGTYVTLTPHGTHLNESS